MKCGISLVHVFGGGVDDGRRLNVNKEKKRPNVSNERERERER